jgi:hypothetical protein
MVAAASGPVGHPSRNEPPVGFSGGFGEDTCVACHFEADLNTGPGSLAIEGLPDSWQPGESYAVTVVLTRPGMKIGGFELTARFAEGGAQAGSLAPAAGHEAQMKVSSSFDVQYAHHVRAGTEVVKADTARWTVVWTAPVQAGTVLFHAAGNAADADDSQFGDYVFATEADLAAAKAREGGSR